MNLIFISDGLSPHRNKLRLIKIFLFAEIAQHSISNQEEKLAQLPGGALNPVLDSLNQLSSVPWRVNKVPTYLLTF